MALDSRICVQCGERYIPKSNTQKLCQNPCRSRNKLTIEQANEAWINRTARKYKLNRLKDYNW